MGFKNSNGTFVLSKYYEFMKPEKQEIIDNLRERVSASCKTKAELEEFMRIYAEKHEPYIHVIEGGRLYPHVNQPIKTKREWIDEFLRQNEGFDVEKLRRFKESDVVKKLDLTQEEIEIATQIDYKPFVVFKDNEKVSVYVFRETAFNGDETPDHYCQAYFVKEEFPETIIRYKVRGTNYEFDCALFLPNEKLVGIEIEFNRKSKKRTIEKMKMLSAQSNYGVIFCKKEDKHFFIDIKQSHGINNIYIDTFNNCIEWIKKRKEENP